MSANLTKDLKIKHFSEKCVSCLLSDDKKQLFKYLSQFERTSSKWAIVS